MKGGVAVLIGVAGYYGFKNAGDAAILAGIVQELRIRGHQIVALSNDPVATAQDFQIEAIYRRNLLALYKADMWLVGGGSLLQDTVGTRRRGLIYWLTIMRMARLFGKSVVAFGQSIGPLTSWGERVLQRYMKDICVVVRDRASYLYGQQLGLRVFLGADPALLLHPPTVERNGNSVVIIPRAGVSRETLLSLLTLANELQDRGKEISIVFMQPGYDDGVADIFSNYPVEITESPNRILRLLAGASYVVSLRLHGLILAAVAGTPYAGIAYDPKVANFAMETAAYYQETPGDPKMLLKAVMENRNPDWEAIRTLKRRAKESFDIALSKTCL